MEEVFRMVSTHQLVDEVAELRASHSNFEPLIDKQEMQVRDCFFLLLSHRLTKPWNWIVWSALSVMWCSQRTSSRR
mgnify:CR=1 FL=1